MFRIFLLCALLMAFSVPSHAQFIGIRIGIPSNNCTGNGGAHLPNGALQDDSGHYLNDDALHYITGS